jgi:hypothetical protein
MPSLESVAKSLTLPEILIRYAEEAPDSPLYSYGAEDKITVKEFLRATHRAAHLCARNSNPGSVVAIIAAYDMLAYQAVVSGIMFAGLAVSYTSYLEDIAPQSHMAFYSRFVFHPV